MLAFLSLAPALSLSFDDSYTIFFFLFHSQYLFGQDVWFVKRTHSIQMLAIQFQMVSWQLIVSSNCIAMLYNSRSHFFLNVFFIPSFFLLFFEHLHSHVFSRRDRSSKIHGNMWNQKWMQVDSKNGPMLPRLSMRYVMPMCRRNAMTFPYFQLLIFHIRSYSLELTAISFSLSLALFIENWFVIRIECNHEDRLYENGDKIDSNNPCRRCVCKGKILIGMDVITIC